MHGIPQIATAWKVFLSVVVPAKIALFGVGYVAWMLAAPSGAKRRAALLEHVRAVIQTLQETGKNPNADTLSELHADLAKLDVKISAGWRDQDDLSALMRLLKFISVVHVRETKTAMYDLKESAWSAIISVIESLLTRKPDAVSL